MKNETRGGLRSGLAVAAMLLGTTLPGAALAQENVSGDLLIYIGHGAADVQPVVDIFLETHPDVRVTLFEQPTGQLMTTLQLEVQSTRNRADLVWAGGAAMAAFDVDNPGALHTFAPPDQEGIPEELRSKDNRIHIVSTIPYILAYNTTMVSAEDSPKSFLDLTDPRWQGLVAMADPATASAVHPFVWYVTQHLADQEGYGIAYWEALGRNQPYLTPGHGELIELVASGERAIAPITITPTELRISRGEPIAYNWPSEGTPLSDSSIAIMSAAPNLDAAEAFVAWLISEEGQRAVPAGFSNVPVNANVSPTFSDGSTAADHLFVVPDNAYLSQNIEEQARIVQDAFESVR